MSAFCTHISAADHVSVPQLTFDRQMPLLLIWSGQVLVGQRERESRLELGLNEERSDQGRKVLRGSPEFIEGTGRYQSRSPEREGDGVGQSQYVETSQAQAGVDGDLPGKDVAGLADIRAENRVIVYAVASADRCLSVSPWGPGEAEGGPEMVPIRAVFAIRPGENILVGVYRGIEGGSSVRLIKARVARLGQALEGERIFDETVDFMRNRTVFVPEAIVDRQPGPYPPAIVEEKVVCREAQADSRIGCACGYGLEYRRRSSYCGEGDSGQ